MVSPRSVTGSIGYESVDNGTPTPAIADTYAEGSLCHRVVSGLAAKDLTMELHADSAGGTYIVADARSRSPIAVFKPADEEVGQDANPHGNTDTDRGDEFAPGTGYLREALAAALDHGCSARVPETHVVTIDGRVGSLQRFVSNCTEAGNHTPLRFSVDDVQRIAIFDVRVLNCDRHGGNILVHAPTNALVPIDHAYILPSGFSDPDFEWMAWPQSKAPFSAEALQYIAALDADRDAAMVAAALGGDEDAGEIVAVTTRLLQHAARAGYTCREIAAFCRRETLTQPSRLERLMAAVRRSIDEGATVDVSRVDGILATELPSR